MKEFLQKIVNDYESNCTDSEEEIHDSLFGENPDDAYDKGCSRGEYLLAKQLLTML